MRVIIDENVWRVLDSFYSVSMAKYPSLDEVTVLKKIDRLQNALLDLGRFPTIYQEARYNQSWKDKHYLVFYYDEFHFAFKIEVTPWGEKVVVIYDVLHRLLYHD